MKILVDADACPVKNIIEQVAKKYGIPVVMLVDDSHVLQSEYSEIITVSQGNDSVDIALINRTSGGDIVVTQDYGVAALALSKNARAIDQNGRIYDDTNIEMLLSQRHMYKRARRGRMRFSSTKKRRVKHTKNFRTAFENMLNYSGDES